MDANGFQKAPKNCSPDVSLLDLLLVLFFFVPWMQSALDTDGHTGCS